MGLQGNPRFYQTPAIDLVMRRVERKAADECWISESPIRGARNPYPVVKVGGRKGKVEYCHLIVFENHYGYRPDDGEVMHLCNNKKCVNPHHLFHGTRSQNSQHAAAIKKGVPLDEYKPCRQTIARMKPELDIL